MRYSVPLIKFTLQSNHKKELLQHHSSPATSSISAATNSFLWTSSYRSLSHHPEHRNQSELEEAGVGLEVEEVDSFLEEEEEIVVGEGFQEEGVGEVLRPEEEEGIVVAVEGSQEVEHPEVEGDLDVVVASLFCPG